MGKMMWKAISKENTAVRSPLRKEGRKGTGGHGGGGVDFAGSWGGCADVGVKAATPVPRARATLSRRLPLPLRNCDFWETATPPSLRAANPFHIHTRWLVPTENAYPLNKSADGSDLGWGGADYSAGRANYGDLMLGDPLVSNVWLKFTSKVIPHGL